MSIIREFQPIPLKYCYEGDGCDCGNAECSQMAEFGDKFSLQLNNDDSAFLGDELILDVATGTIWVGDFENEGAGPGFTNWGNVADGLANWVLNAVAPIEGTYDAKAAAGDSNRLQNLNNMAGVAAGDWCRLKFQFSDLCEDCQIGVYFYNGAAWTLYTSFSGELDADTYILDFQAPDAITRVGLKYVDLGSCACDLQVDMISFREYDFSSIGIYNCCDDTLVDAIDDGDVYVTEDTIYIQGNWSDYVSTNGCYKICADGVNLITNGHFTYNEDGWENIGSNIEWERDPADQTAKAESAVGAFTTDEWRWEFDEPLDPNCDYVLEYDVASDALDEVEVYVNGVLWYSSDQIGTLNTTITGLNVPIYSIGFIGIATGAGYISLDNINIEVDLCSPCICVAEVQPQCNTYIEAWNDSATSEFEFDNDFKFYLRLHSKIANPRYPTEEEIYLSSAGHNTLNYARSEKHWDYQINSVPEYIWDALTTIMMMDNIYIDGVRYVKVEGDIEPKWRRKNTKVAGGTIVIKKYLENRKK